MGWPERYLCRHAVSGKRQPHHQSSIKVSGTIVQHRSLSYFEYFPLACERVVDTPLSLQRSKLRFRLLTRSESVFE